MCHSVECGKCKKTSWSGCGQHLESVFRNIKIEDRCFCGYTTEELEDEKKHPKYKNLGPLPKGQSSCSIQ
jgi:hypothetical protein